MLARPPRRVAGDVTHAWESQALQYQRPDVPRVPAGLTHWTVPADEAPVRIECLLLWNPPAGRSIHLGVLPAVRAAAAELIGILNYYPEGSPYGEEPHDVLVLVHPEHRREGVGTILLTEAMRLWPGIDLLTQSYTTAGWELARSLLEDS